MPSIGKGEDRDALLSAVMRLPHPILTCDGNRQLRAVNRAAVRFMDSEQIAADLIERDPDHPVAVLIADTLQGDDGTVRIVQLPSGGRFEVEISFRSRKGDDRWLLLVFRDLLQSESERQEIRFSMWKLTQKEREVAQMLCAGVDTDVMCERLGITANTLKTHVSNVLAKSGTMNRSSFLAKILAPLRPDERQS